MRRCALAWEILLTMAVFLALAGSADAAVPVTIEPYNSPVISEDADGTLIEVPERPAGLYYRAQLDPSRTYRVTIDGDPTAGPFLLRSRSDAQTPVYRQAPYQESYRVSGVREHELLFFNNYATDAASYRVRSVTIEDCAGVCKTDSDLREQILEETPGLAAALAAGDSYKAAVLVLGWAAPRSPAAGIGLPPLTTRDSTAASLYYDNFRNATAGVYCGGAADFLHKVLDLFSISSFELLFGDASFFTHVVVVLPLEDGHGGMGYRILDPTFDMHYSLASTGEPASVPQLLELWRAGMTDRIVLNEGDLGERRVVTPDKASGRLSSAACDEGAQSTMCSFRAFQEGWRDVFRGQGYDSDLGGILRLLGTAEVFPDFFEIPQAFLDMREVFKDAVTGSKDDVHVAGLPIPPSSGRPPRLSGSPAPGRLLEVSEVDWRIALASRRLGPADTLRLVFRNPTASALRGTATAAILRKGARTAARPLSGFRLAPGQRKKVIVRLSRRDRRSLRGSRSLRARVTVRLRGPGGAATEVSQMFRLFRRTPRSAHGGWLVAG